MVFHGGNGQCKTVIYQYKQFIERPIYSDTMLENTGYAVSKIINAVWCDGNASLHTCPGVIFECESTKRDLEKGGYVCFHKVLPLTYRFSQA